MDKKNWVVQHNALVTARYRLTVEEQRLIKTVVSLIHRNDEDFKSYEIKIAELAKILGIVDASYYSRVKKVIKGILNDRTVLDFVNEHGQEVQTRWLSSAVYSPNEGIVELRFDPVLKPYLLQLKTIFTYYELENILQLRGMYSIRIYELLKQYESIGKREFSLDDFKKILIIEDKYKEYRELKKYVISPAIKEVCEKTDISFSLEEKTKGRKVVGLVFYIQKKRLPIEIDLSKTEQKESLPNELVERLVAMGVTRYTAGQIAVEFDQERIERAIAYTQDKQQEGGVKNTAAFVVTAIKKDFNDALAEEKRKKAEAVRLQKQQEKLKKQWQTIKTRYSDWKMQTVEAALLAMPPEEQEGYQQQFKKTPIYEAMLDVFRKNKTIQQRLFLTFMSEHVALDTLEEWAQKNAVDLSVFPDEIRCE